MNKLILNTGVQDFVKKNWNTDIMSVLLKERTFPGIEQQELVQQLECKKKAKDKLPSWFNSTGIYYPKKIHIEQTSSEVTAKYKSALVDGEELVDLTGGFGVDSFYFSNRVKLVSHCETNTELSAIAAYNFAQLQKKNIECHATNGFDFLKDSKKAVDWIFIDPSRRNESKGKVFLLKDCEPNVPENLPLLFSHSKNVLIKTSPLLDLKQAIKELVFVMEVHVVAVNNEVKEILFNLKDDHQGETMFTAVNIKNGKNDIFKFLMEEETSQKLDFDLPKTFLYEPNSAILKSGAFKTIGYRYGLKKLHQHSHLYTSNELKDFPGRRFRITSDIIYSRNALKDLKGKKANITTRNFPISVEELRKKHKIRDGGTDYLFFTKTMDGKKRVLFCERIP